MDPILWDASSDGVTYQFSWNYSQLLELRMHKLVSAAILIYHVD